MIEYDVNKRYSAKNVLEDPWFHTEQNLDIGVL